MNMPGFTAENSLVNKMVISSAKESSRARYIFGVDRIGAPILPQACWPDSMHPGLCCCDCWGFLKCGISCGSC